MISLNFAFFFNSIFLGVGLAMDAFSVSLANGLNEPKMKRSKIYAIAGIFSLFQFLMPMLGWFCVHNIAKVFTAFEKFIPWIALILLVLIGGKMLAEGFEKKEDGTCRTRLGLGALFLQGIATSIDALSVGFTTSGYSALEALICCLLIAAVTFIICTAGVLLGKSFGTRFAGKATIFGGLILILIALEIFITGIF